jgi:prepilin peptidase CpaA
MVLDALVLLVFPAAMVCAAVSDLLTMTIPNRIQAALALAFAGAAVAAGLDLQTVGLHVAAALAVLALGFACFAFGWMGGGDAKLMAATALWFGFGMQLAEFLMVAAVYGGVLTLLLLAARGLPLPQALAGHGWVLRLHDSKTGVPYGIALAAAALTVFPDTAIFARAIG